MKARLRIEPVKRYPGPKYPTKVEVTLDPSVLRSLPRRWSAKPAVCAALLLTLTTGLYSCGSGDEGSGTEDGSSVVSEPLNQPSTTGTGDTTTTKSGNNNSPGLSIPFFEHGNGRGSYGCVSVAPPVFLSEDEAAQVIREEVAKAGVSFSDSKSIEGKFPATNLYGDESMKDATWDGTLKLDGYDRTLGIGFEFISQQDVEDWQKNGNMMSSVSTYEMKDTAKRLSDSVKDVAVFYDPGMDWTNIKFDYNSYSKNYSDYQAYINEFTAAQKAQMLENLRAQVRDFLAWLAAEGII